MFTGVKHVMIEKVMKRGRLLSISYRLSVIGYRLQEGLLKREPPTENR